MISYLGLKKSEVLMALFNNADFYHLPCASLQKDRITLNEAEEILKNTQVFNILYGKTLKVSLVKNGEFDETFYDRFNGEGLAERAINSLYEEKSNYLKEL